MTFNKANFGMFREDIEKALKSVEEKYEVSIHAGSISYSNVSFNMKLEVTKSDVNAEKIEFERLCRFYGFKEDHYHAEFSDEKGRTFLLIGFKPKASKNDTIIREKITGKDYVCNHRYVAVKLAV